MPVNIPKSTFGFEKVLLPTYDECQEVQNKFSSIFETKTNEIAQRIDYCHTNLKEMVDHLKQEFENTTTEFASNLDEKLDREFFQKNLQELKNELEGVAFSARIKEMMSEHLKNITAESNQHSEHFKGLLNEGAQIEQNIKPSTDLAVQNVQSQTNALLDNLNAIRNGFVEDKKSLSEHIDDINVQLKLFNATISTKSDEIEGKIRKLNAELCKIKILESDEQIDENRKSANRLKTPNEQKGNNSKGRREQQLTITHLSFWGRFRWFFFGYVK